MESHHLDGRDQLHCRVEPSLAQRNTARLGRELSPLRPVESPGENRPGNLQRSKHPFQTQERRIPFSPLHAPDVGAMESRLVSKSLLRQLSLLAKGAEDAPEGFQVRPVSTHRLQLRSCTPCVYRL